MSNEERIRQEALAEADNQWIEALAVRWGEYTVSPEQPMGGTWPLGLGATRSETIESHTKFIYDELRKLRSSPHG